MRLVESGGRSAGATLLLDAVESAEPPLLDLQAVSVVVINFNGGVLLADCLERVLTQTHSAAEIIVVDNRSTDESTATIRQRFPAVRVIESLRNIGYAGAANVAVR